MATATLYFTSSVSGNVVTPANALGAPDATYTTNTGNTSWTHRWALGSVAGVPSGTQSLTLRVRRSGTGNGTCTVDSVTLHQGATSTVISGGAFTPIQGGGTNFDDYLVTFSDTVLDGTLDGVEIELVTTGAGGGPNANSVQIDAATWDAVYLVDTVLTSANVESSSSVDAVLLEQIFYMNLGGVESATTIDLAAVQTSHILQTIDSSIASDANTVILVQQHPLSQNEIQTTTNVNTVAADTEHHLSHASIETNSAIIAVAIDTEHHLATNDSSIASDANTVHLVQQHPLSQNEIQTTTDVNTVAADTEHHLSHASISSNTDVNAVAVDTEHHLQQSSISSNTDVNAVAVDTEHPLSQNEIQPDVDVDFVLLVQNHQSTVGSITLNIEMPAVLSDLGKKYEIKNIQEIEITADTLMLSWNIPDDPFSPPTWTRV